MAKRKTVTTSGNKTTVPVSWKSILGAAAFGKGFQEVRKGKPFNSDRIPPGKDWHYERGRLFGVIYTGQIKAGRTILAAAIYTFAAAYRDKAIL